MGELDIDGSAVVDAIDQPTVVVTDADSILHYNDEFQALTGDTVSSSLDSALSDHPELREQIQSRESGSSTLHVDGEVRHFQVRISEVSGAENSALGDLVIFHDVTEQQKHQQHLEHQNEQLDQFASLISHDLRNPLDVAIGRTTVIEELVDDDAIAEHISELNAAHGRMRQIIQDVLTLARDGRRIDDTRPVKLADVAEGAWSHVQTTNATLEVDTDARIVADRDRLEQVFENLFRNSLTHGRSGGDDDPDRITVSVGNLNSGGFYVADDGQGIKETDSEKILEAGYTGEHGNTGLGLAIVRKIAAAHDWDITISQSTSGGARFEFHGVEAAPAEEPLQEP